MDCYRCNKPLTKLEMQHWLPFDFCTECNLEIALDKANAEANKSALRDYWQLSRNEQYRVQLFAKEITE